MFKLKDGREELWQWDIDRKLLISDESITEVHFSNRNSLESLAVAVVNHEANIPNVLLKDYGAITAYAYTDCHTKVEKEFKVNRKIKPIDYEYVETETVNWDKINEKVAEAENSAANAKQSEISANESEAQSSKNLSDLLATIGSSVPSLVGGKVPMSQIPATATTEIYEVKSKDELVNLEAQKGDLAELIEIINDERTITKTWQLLNNNPKELANWVVWGTSYAVQCGNASRALDANNAERINNMRFVTMNYSEFKDAVKDANTLYAVDMEA